MKALLLLTMSLLTSFSLSASQPEFIDGDNCRKSLNKIDPQLPIQEQVRQDLLQGSWKEGQFSHKQWNFQEDGSVQLVSKTQDAGYQSIDCNWNVSNSNGFTILHIEEAESNLSLRFFVEQTCDGITLDNLDADEQIQLAYQDVASSKRAKAIKAITGHWENVLNPKQIEAIDHFNEVAQGPKRATLSLDFYPDGTFVQLLDYKEGGISDREKGKWTISKDGQFLLLSELSGEETSRVIPIKYLELDELVVAQVLPMATAIAPEKGFYFNKY